MMATAVVNARVGIEERDATVGILSGAGITMSEAIRSFVRLIASTGEIPDFVTKEATSVRAARASAAEGFLSRVESIPTPGYDPSVTDERIVAEERMARFG